MTTQTMIVCDGKISAGGLCDKCHQQAQASSSVYCGRLIHKDQLTKEQEILEWLEWLDKRCGFTEHQKDYVHFVMLQISRKSERVT